MTTSETKKTPKINESAEQNIVKMISESLKSEYKETNAEKHVGFSNELCPYNQCDGSGYITIREGIRFVAKECLCYKEEVMLRKLRNANITLSKGEKLLEEDFLLDEQKATILHPLENPKPRKIDKRRKNIPDEEPEEYIKRIYQQLPLKDNFGPFLNEYKAKTIEYFDEPERTKVRNILFIGDFMSGVKNIANTLGRHYLMNGKKVYAITMKNLIEEYIKNTNDIQNKIKRVDFLIIKDLGQEYHTDNGWAISQIKDLLYTRYENKLPVIATTEFYPNEINKLYGDKIMGLVNATYFIVYVEHDGFNTAEADSFLKEFSSISLEEGGE